MCRERWWRHGTVIGCTQFLLLSWKFVSSFVVIKTIFGIATFELELGCTGKETTAAPAAAAAAATP
jgi:hypothetical protein